MINLDIKEIFARIKNYLKGKITRGYKKTKESLRPKNIIENIKNLPSLDRVYWSKVRAAFMF